MTTKPFERRVPSLARALFPTLAAASCAALAAGLCSAPALAAAPAETLEVTILGPGGHSNGSYGNVNALHAGARAVLEIEKAVPTAAVAGLSGGVSVNAIAADCRFTVLLADPADEAKVKAAVERGVAAENAFRGVKPGEVRDGVQVDVRAEVKRAD